MTRSVRPAHDVYGKRELGSSKEYMAGGQENGLKIKLELFRLGMKKNIFPMSVVQQWRMLSRVIVQYSPLKVF